MRLTMRANRWGVRANGENYGAAGVSFSDGSPRGTAGKK